MRTGAFAQPNPCQTKRAAPCMATLFAPFFDLQPPHRDVYGLHD